MTDDDDDDDDDDELCGLIWMVVMVMMMTMMMTTVHPNPRQTALIPTKDEPRIGHLSKTELAS